MEKLKTAREYKDLVDNTVKSAFIFDIVSNKIIETWVQHPHHLTTFRKTMKEKIICAAIHNPDEKDIAGNPLIYCGLRHANILWQSKLVSRNPRHQGFLTSKGRFVDRKEGLKIALENNQVIDISQIRGDNLYSEDLY